MGAATADPQKAPEEHIIKGIIYPVMGALQNFMGVSCLGKFALSGSDFASIYNSAKGEGNAAEDGGDFEDTGD